MSDGLKELDQTHAIFGALAPFWWRILLLFVLAVFGHYVGVNCAEAADLGRVLMSFGPSAVLSADALNPAMAPVSWIGTVIVGCAHPVGLLQLIALAVAFLIVWVAEDRVLHAFAIVLITQPIDSFLVHVDGGRVDFVIGLVLLIIYEAFALFAYWWVLRNSD